MRPTGSRWRTRAGARARTVPAAGVRSERGMDCHLGAAVSVPRLRPHDEPVAGLAASVAVVCGNSDYRSAVPAFDFERTGARNPCALRRHKHRMAKSAAMAGTVVVVADIVGLVEIATGNHRAGGASKTGAVASEAVAGRDADRLRDGRGGFR